MSSSTRADVVSLQCSARRCRAIGLLFALGLGLAACGALWSSHAGATTPVTSERPVVFFSITGSLPVRVVEQHSTERYVTHEVEVDEAALVVAVPKRVHTANDVYFSIVENATVLLDDVVAYGPRFDLDNVGGVVPGTQSEKQLAMTLLTLVDGNPNMALYHVQSATKRGDTYHLTLHHDSTAPTISSFAAHADFDVEASRHYHTAGVTDVTRRLVTGTFDTWGIEMYLPNCNSDAQQVGCENNPNKQT